MLWEVLWVLTFFVLNSAVNLFSIFLLGLVASVSDNQMLLVTMTLFPGDVVFLVEII